METAEKPQEKKLKLMAWPLRIVIGLLAGLLGCGIGCAIPGVGMLFTVFMFFCPLLGLIAFGAGDVLSFAAWAAVALGGGWFLGGSTLCVIYLLAAVAPCAYVCAQEKRGAAFFKILIGGFVACIAGMLASLVLLTLIFGNNLGELAANAIGSLFLSFGEETKDALAQYYTLLYSAMGTSLEGISSTEILTSIAAFMGEIVKVGTAGMLILLSAVNMLPGVLISCFIRAKRNVPGAGWVSVRKWRMPLSVIVGLIVFFVLGLVLSARVEGAGDVVLCTVVIAIIVASCVQYCASIWDRFCHAPMTSRMRAVMFIIVTLLLFQMIPLYGVLSMLIGHRGLIGILMQRRRQSPKNGD